MKLSDIKGVGKSTLEQLNKEGVTTIDELLFTYPNSYEVYEFDENKIFSGEYICLNAVCDTKPAFIKYRSNVYSVIFYCFVLGYRVKCIFFSSDYLRYKLFKGTSIVLYGRFKKEDNEFYVKRVFFDDFRQKINVSYKYKNIKAYQIQRIVSNIKELGYRVDETIPKELIKKYKLFSMNELVYKAHLPIEKLDIIQINRRRKYEEFFWYAMSFNILRTMRSKSEKQKRNIDMDFMKYFVDSLSFELTIGQKDAIRDVTKDILGKYPMNRLIQGDVGCGKSIVAIFAILALVTSGYQAALMLPTEILANQQYQLILDYFKKFNIKVELLTSSIKKTERNKILKGLEDGSVEVLVGTHSLIQGDVKFHKLGIAVIDEQHKFGVNQRKALIEKYPNTDALYLTATPIPRTLGLTFFGDLDITSIKTMPKGRIPVDTKIISYSKLKALMHFIEGKIMLGEQAYVVVPLVIENQDYDAIPIEKAEEMFKEELPNIPIGVVHGKMATDKKNQVMEDFKNGNIKILISTTVIEVGVNVVNATIMVILDADRFGLAQIHQLRGRVGRGLKQSYCALVTKRLDNERLKVLENTLDGFGISENDFRLRGPGNYFGEEQSGFLSLEYADFETDYKIWECAKEDADDYFPKYMNGEEKSIRFNDLIIENAKNGFNSN
ncbi:MAG: ATP-dependent DNA helicase RecG [Anaeroplasma sp.]|uniref:ATP-dependent DNA helicase RecG n=1 Tax=Anaeroplasma sp. TaxID=1872523 RepID=UPI002A90B024|nr:ATP-dependent DNA helicase RecG [Anaeroplasma sp.]MDY5982567.1 ATP-dependent DNA helicase RecG [Anaeroplasma sp.]